MRIEPDKSVANSLIFFFLLFLSPFALSQDSTLISFKMKDQFDNVYTDEEFRDSIVIIIGCDKDGSKYNSIWSKAIYDSLKNEKEFNQIKFLGVADLRGVPFFLKDFAKGKFPKEKEKWVLLDWKGHFAKAYQFDSKMSNIAIFDRNGILVYKTSEQALDHQKLGVILEKLKTLMKNR